MTGMRGLTFFLVSTVLLAGSIVATVLYAEESPATLAVVVPVMIASFFGMLQPLMWLLSRFGLPTPDPAASPRSTRRAQAGAAGTRG